MKIASLFIALVLLAGCGRTGPIEVNPNPIQPPPISPSPTPIPTSTPTPTPAPRNLLEMRADGTSHFGAVSVELAQPAAKSFLLSNSGEVPVGGLTIEVSGVGFAILSSNCTSELLPGRTCAIVVGFLPRQLIEYRGGLRAAAAGSHFAQVEFTGNGVAAPRGHLALVNPNDLSFGRILSGGISERLLVFVNDGNAPLLEVGPGYLEGRNVEHYALNFGAYADNLQRCGPGVALDPGERCAVLVRFSPRLPTGTQVPQTLLARIPIHFFDTDHRAFWVELSGVSSAPPVLTLEGGTMPNFRRVDPGESTVACVTLTNPFDAQAIRVRRETDPPVGFTIDGSVRCANIQCADLPLATLPGRGACDVPVRFTHRNPGEFTYSLGMSYFDGIQARTVTRAITAQATRKCDFSISRLVFGYGAGGVSSPGTVHNGDTTLTLPTDATKINATMTKIHVDDYAPFVKINGTVVYDGRQENRRDAHDIHLSRNVDLRPGANTVWAQATNNIDLPISVSITVSGSYTTSGACTAR